MWSDICLTLTLNPPYIKIKINFFAGRSRHKRQSGRGEEGLLRRELFLWKSSDKWSLEEENTVYMDHVKDLLHLPDPNKKSQH